MATCDASPLPLCRPKRLPDEWTETYLFRVARANGIPRPRLSDIERFRPMLPVIASSKSDGYPVWSDAPLPRWSVATRVNKIRYCPACMVESRHIRSRWRLTIFEVCTLHHIRLKDNLAERVMTRGYKQDGKYFVTEVTDEQLWEGAVCPMPGERQHVQRLWSGFELLIIQGNLFGAFEHLVYILFLEALLDALAYATPESDAIPVEAPRSTRLAGLAAKYQFILVPDSNGIGDFLRQITAPPHRDAALARLRRMLLDEAQRPTCLSRLPISDLRRHLLLEGGKSVTPQTRGELHPDHNVPDGYISFEKAASLIGCSRYLLGHVIAENICEDSIAVEHGRKRYLYLSLHAVEAGRRWYASIVTREQVMNDLHITPHECATLLKSGLLQPQGTGRWTYFHRAHLTALSRRLEVLSQPCPINTACLKPLFGAWLQWGGRDTSSSREVLREVLGGKFPLFRRPENPGLSAYLVDWTAIERLRRSLMSSAARRTGEKEVSQQFLLLPE